MSRNHFRAQALVEFALVIVLLLMIVFGLLEVSRLLFVYAAIITSSREAVRYGSVAGINDAGNLYYQDCDGIRNTARRLAFFQDLDDEHILIEHDTGPDDLTPVPYCIWDDASVVANGVDESVNLVQGQRIRVSITASFIPIVPIVPIGDMVINSTSARTIMGIIEIE